MERSSVDQAVETLLRAQRGILLVVPPEPTSDAFASMIALGLALETLSKSTTIVCPSHVPQLLQFLPGTALVHDHLPHVPEAVLSLPLGDVPPDHVRWEIVDNTLRVTVRPASHVAADAQVTLEQGAYPWDCVVTLGSARLHALGGLFTEHAPFFYQTPLVNIDRGTANEFFGTVNLVPATAGTIAEVVTDLLDILGGTHMFSPEIATCLLAAITAATQSFRTPSTTPRTFQVASLLTEQHADRQTVIRRLFHTHTLPELRLLGRALTRVSELSPRALWSFLSQQDFTEHDASPDLVPTVFQELLQWVGDQRTALIAFERQPGSLEVLISLGRVSAEDREAFRAGLSGTAVGPWVFVNLGPASVTDAGRLLEERVLPRLPHAAAEA